MCHLSAAIAVRVLGAPSSLWGAGILVGGERPEPKGACLSTMSDSDLVKENAALKEELKQLKAKVGRVRANVEPESRIQA